MSRGKAVSLPILTYHSLDESGSVVSMAPRLFADQMARLAERGVRGVSLREAVAHRAARAAWPARRVVLTFDDGYANFYEQAFPVIERHGFTATVFVVSSHVGGRNDWAPPPPRLGRQNLLAWPRLTELNAHGIEIASHSHTHPDLRGVSGERAEREVAGSRREIEDRIGVPVESFAYPFGGVSPMASNIVRREYRSACTTLLRRARDEDTHRLPRVDMYYVRSPDRLERLMDGRLDGYLRVRRWGRAVREMLRG